MLVRFYRDGAHYLSLNESQASEARLQESPTRIPQFEVRFHTPQVGFGLGRISAGDTLELWAGALGVADEELFRVVILQVDFVEYVRDDTGETVEIQARSPAGSLLDRGCDLRVEGELAEIVAKIIEGSRVDCTVAGLHAPSLSVSVHSASCYAALRAIATSLGAILQHRPDGSLVLISTEEAQRLLTSKPAHRIDADEISRARHTSGVPIRKLDR